MATYQQTATGWEVRDKTGDLHLHCKLLLVADGAHSYFSRHIAGHQKDNAHHAAALRAYYQGVTGFHDDNFIELHFLPELNPGYFWIFPLPDGGANVGLGMRSDFMGNRGVGSVGEFLRGIGLGRYAGTFAEEEIDMDAMGHLRDKDLQSMGLPLGPRKKIIAALK